MVAYPKGVPQRWRFQGGCWTEPLLSSRTLSGSDDVVPEEPEHLS
jgi:hypothetical protein